MEFFDRMQGFKPLCMPRKSYKGSVNSNYVLRNNSLNYALKAHNLTSDEFVKTTPSAINVSNDIHTNELALKNPKDFITRYLNPTTIEEQISKNPAISELLQNYGLDEQYNIDNVSSIINTHLIPTAKKAQDMYLSCGHSKNENSYLYLTQAALLHDIGKVFIPSDILNKKSVLSEDEKEIVNLHNRLSYELLKNDSLNPQVAKLALEHHDYGNNITRNDENQVLTVADIYCALREKRPYKEPLDHKSALEILNSECAKEKFSYEYIQHIA